MALATILDCVTNNQPPSRSRLAAAPRSCGRGCLLPDLNRHDIVLRCGGERIPTSRHRDRLTRLLVDEALSFIVPEDHFVLGDLFHVLGKERHLAAAPWRVDDEMRNGKTGSPSSERL